MPEEWAPPVVAVVVTSDPGEWLEACLQSLSGQDYPNLTVLVVDDASETDVTARVAAIEPAAIVRRRATRGGYALVSNEALQGIEGASFFLFCHDDVELDSGAVQALVEEAFRSNAAVVGPKLVGADNPELLVAVGLGMHRLGTPVPRVAPGELDQSQHDGARDVFVVPGGCTLVRADLFEALEGFDPAMSLFGEDVDFCWRAQIAGARVTVAPQARVRHRQRAASGERGPEDVALLQRRHELRAALKNYGLWRRLIVTLELILLAVAEMVIATSSGERERARRVARAWRWNIAERRSLRAARRHLREIRQVPDRELVRRMSGRGRVRRFVRPEASAHAPERLRSAMSEIEHALEVERLGSWWTRVQMGEVPAGQLSLAAVIIVLGIFGVRDLLFSRLPLVGELVPFPTGSTMLARFFGGLPSGGSVRAAPTAFGIVGLLGLVLANSSALAWKLLEIGSLVAGAIGVSRLCRPFLSSRGRLVAALAFLVLPLAWNSLATGNVEAAVSLGLLPYVFSRLGRASGLEPFASVPPSRARSVVGEIVPFGILLAVLVALAPPGLLAAGVVMLAVVVSCVLSGHARAGLRALLVSLGALLVAACCCLPWSLSWFESGSRWSAFSGVVPGSQLDPASLLRGHTGPIAGWWGAWGLVLAGGYVLLVARSERLRWAAAWWLAAIGAVALAWAGSRGWLGAGGGSSSVLAAPAAVAVAAACGLGVAAFERDVLTGRSLGWRQAAAGLGCLCLLVGTLPALAVMIGGRADLPSQGIDQTLDWMGTTNSAYRVVWLGDPRSLPAAGWQLAPGLAWYATVGGLPAATEEWPQANPGSEARVEAVLEKALQQKTVDVGALLAPLGVRYVVVPLADAPALVGTQVPPVVAPPPAGLVSVLEAQGDLIERPVEAGAIVFDNAAWTGRDSPRPAALISGPGGGSSAVWREIGVAAGLLAWLLCIAEGVARRRRLDRAAAPPEPVAETPEPSAHSDEPVLVR